MKRSVKSNQSFMFFSGASLMLFLSSLFPLPSSFFLYGGVVDRIVAIVNEEIITASDLNWAVTLEAQQTNSAKPDRQAVLKRLIDERLIAQEAANAPPVTITAEVIDESVSKLRQKFPSPAAFETALYDNGITPGELRDQIRRKILVLQFIDQRFRPFIIVPPEEIQSYYEKEFRAELQRRQITKMPDLAGVRDQIEAILVERKVSQESERWIQELRDRASVRLLVNLP